MIIRIASLKDFEQVRDLDKEFYVWACKINPWLDSNYPKIKHAQEFHKDFFNKNGIFFVAEDKGKIFAYAEGVIEEESQKFRNKKVGSLESLYVKKLYRREKVGEQLVLKVLDWFKSRKVNNYKLMVHHSNYKAYNLYKKLGFKDYFWIMRK